MKSPSRTSKGAKPESAKGAITLEMVAQAAGVSPSTVSRILNGTAVVSALKKQAVDDAIARLGFVPNPIGLLGLAMAPGLASAQQSLTVAAYPAVDEIVRAAIPHWKKRHPAVEIKVVSRQFSDHHTAMTTALSTSVYLPDMMALEVGYLGRFAQGGGLDVLSAPPYNIAQFKGRCLAYAYQQATNHRADVVAAPTDIGPGTLLYRQDVLAKAGLVEADLTQSWDAYVAAGMKIKATTGSYLMAHARDMKGILIRTGIQPGEGLYYDQQSNVLVNSPRFVRAFELAREVRRNKLDAKVGAWSNEPKSGSYPVAGRASGRLNGPRVGAILSLT